MAKLAEMLLMFIRPSIGRRMALWALAFSAVVILTFTGLQLREEFKHDVMSIESRLEQIRQSYSSSLSYSLWVTSQKDAQLQLDGIIRLPDMQYLEIRSDQDHILATAGKLQDNRIIRQETPLYFDYLGKHIYVGKLIAVASLEDAYQRIENRIITTLLRQSIQTFLVSLFILFMFQQLLGRHLNKISQYSEHLLLDSDCKPLELDRNGIRRTYKDELDLLVTSINNMQQRLVTAFQDIRDSNTRFHSVSLYSRSLIEASLDPLVTINAEGKITDVNEATIKVTGRQREELIGTDFSNYFTEPDKARVGYQQVFAEGFVTDYPLVLRHCDGHVTEVLYNASVYHNEAGKVLGVFAAARDVTERNKAETALRESEALFQAVLRILPVGLWVADATGKLVFGNDKGKQIWAGTQFVGIERYGEYKGWLLDSGKPLGAHDWGMARAIEKGEISIEEEIEIECFDGTHKIIFNSALPLRRSDGSISGAIGVNQDITERKQAEVELRKYRENLEDIVLERTSQLEAANKELEAFSYSVSHDLRTPLRAIDGFSHILLNDYTDKLDDEGKRLLNVVRDSTIRMGQLIDDMLKFSRTSRLEMTLSAIDMEGLAHSVVKEFQLADGKLQVEIEPIPPATGDRAMMHQVFVNLLSNAIKFSRNKETPIIKVGGSIKENEAIYYVKDNGAGFNMEYADKLFGVFQRLHGIDDFEGTGIGLAIVKSIITRHGGRVWAEGKVNEGATIYFVLPTK